MAEVIFSNLAKKYGRDDLVIKSAGTHAFDGADMADLSKQALFECGEVLPETKFSATQFVYSMNDEFDFVIDLREFDDPWGGDISDYIKACKTLQSFCKALYNERCKT